MYKKKCLFYFFSSLKEYLKRNMIKKYINFGPIINDKKINYKK